MPQQLTLQFLGPPQLYLNHEPVIADRRKAIALLAYLAVQGDRQTRDSLSALLWPDYDQSKAFTNLRHIVWEIQKMIGEGWILADRETIGWSPEADISVDVHQLETLLAQAFKQKDVPVRAAQLADSVKLYRGHFLTGFSLKDAPEFNEWAFAKSEEFRQQFARVLTVLSDDLCTLGQPEQSIVYARRLITLDPLNEASHRQLMQVYIQAGQYSAALKQYQACEQILRKELGMDPQPETRELYKKIRKREIQPVPVKNQSEKRVPQHNLPLQLSSFIGREKEQGEVTHLVARQRLVTLVGAGGIGKTRLALQTGHNVLNDFQDGVWFIGLDSLSDPALTTQTVASVFDLREGSDRPLLERLIDVLRPKTALLFFDNCEHLLESCAQLITTLLINCPNIKVMATSREVLGINGEAMYSMPSLPLPDPNSAEEWVKNASVQLFAERASLVLTSFQVTPENAPAVAGICRRVDGIPLAIELAAAHVNVFQVDEILAQLQQSFALLVNDTRGILPRQQTLRGSIEWSWGLLGEEEQTFLRQLSVFAGGWTLAAAREICTGDVLALSSSLVKKSLIVVDQQTGRETRYRFHDMVREFAREQLMRSGEREKVRTYHLNYFLKLSTQAQLELRGPSRVDWMERLSEERNNLRAALHWAEHISVESGLLLAGRLTRYWESFNLREGVQWLETFLQNQASCDFPAARAGALHAYGVLLIWLQNFEQAQKIAEECIALFRAQRDRAGEVDGLLLFGNSFMFQQDTIAAQTYGDQALKLARSIKDPWREANALYYLGWVTRDYPRMYDYWEKAISLFREVDDQVSLANALGWISQFRVLNGDFELAESHIEEALQLWQSNKRANIWDNAKIAKSLLLLARGEYEQSRTMLQEIKVTAEETGNIMSRLWTEVRLGYVALRSGNLTEAHHFLKKSAYGFADDGYNVGTLFALEGMAAIYGATGKLARTAQLIGWADAYRAKIRDHRPMTEQADIDKLIAACLAGMGEAAFSDAYEEGATMTIQKAIAFAFEEN